MYYKITLNWEVNLVELTSLKVDLVGVDLMGGQLNDVTVYNSTAYTKTRRATRTIDSKLSFLYLSNNCEHFALSVLYRVSSIVCLKVLQDMLSLNC